MHFCKYLDHIYQVQAAIAFFFTCSELCSLYRGAAILGKLFCNGSALKLETNSVLLMVICNDITIEFNK